MRIAHAHLRPTATLRCGLCHEDVEAGPQVLVCGRCGGARHRTCAAELALGRRCGTLGCPAVLESDASAPAGYAALVPPPAAVRSAATRPVPDWIASARPFETHAVAAQRTLHVRPHAAPAEQHRRAEVVPPVQRQIVSGWFKVMFVVSCVVLLLGVLGYSHAKEYGWRTFYDKGVTEGMLGLAMLALILFGAFTAVSGVIVLVAEIEARVDWS